MSLATIVTTVHATLARLSIEVLARAGGGSGGGRSSSGGSSSRSSSGSSGSSSSFFGSGSGGGGGAAGALFALIFGGVCLFIIVIFVIIAVRAAKKKGISGEQMAGLPAQLANVQQYGAPADGSVPHADSRAELDAGLAKITQHDPAFSEADFLADVNRAFFAIQQAWTERKPDLSRRVMADGVWQQHQFQIQQYLSANKQNVLENLAVQNTRLVSADSDASWDTIVVRFFASCADYDIDLSNEKHKVVRGSNSIEDWAEDWVFQRKSQAVTKPSGGVMNQKCPNCGAPLDLDLAGTCNYCHQGIMGGDYDWVLTRIEQLPNYEYAQQTVPG
jgi:predicted lipid-binding transport protein (Tim44 family)